MRKPTYAEAAATSGRSRLDWRDQGMQSVTAHTADATSRQAGPPSRVAPQPGGSFDGRGVNPSREKEGGHLPEALQEDNSPPPTVAQQAPAAREDPSWKQVRHRRSRLDKDEEVTGIIWNLPHSADPIQVGRQILELSKTQLKFAWRGSGHHRHMVMKWDNPAHKSWTKDAVLKACSELGLKVARHNRTWAVRQEHSELRSQKEAHPLPMGRNPRTPTPT